MIVSRCITTLAVAVAALALVLVACGDNDAAPPPTAAAKTPTPPTNAEMTTDAAALSAAASEFDRISSDLKSSISQADSIAGELASTLSGPAGAAAQAAFVRFRDAAQRQVQELNDIQENINRAGIQYQSAGDDSSSSLQDSMGFEDPPGGSLNYSFSGIEDALSTLQGNASTIRGLLDEGGASVQKLATIWGGAGSDAYLVTQQRWDTTAAELNAALADLVQKLSEAAESMQNTEQGTGGMFG